jgi:predicted porin
MKKIIIISIGFLFLQLSRAQDSTSFTSKKSEFNIGYFNLFQLSSINNLGVGYKYVFGNGALRLGTSLNYNYSEYKSISDTSKSTNTTIIPRIGYEFRQNYNRIIVYYGADITGSIQKQISTGSNNSKQDNTSYGIGLSPFIGVKYFVSKNISLSTETSFNFMYSSGKDKQTYNGVPSNDSNNQSISTRLSPLGIFSINIHF